MSPRSGRAEIGTLSPQMPSAEVLFFAHPRAHDSNISLQRLTKIRETSARLRLHPLFDLLILFRTK